MAFKEVPRKYFCYFVIITVNLNSVFCENKFKSIPVTVKSFENDTVLLPCYLHDTGE